MAESFDLAAWVRASCEAQGVPVKVEDPDVVNRVCAVLRASEPGTGSCGSTTGSRSTTSELPDRLDTLGVELGGLRATGSDHGVVEHGSDDGVLPVEDEPGPLVA